MSDKKKDFRRQGWAHKLLYLMLHDFDWRTDDAQEAIGVAKEMAIKYPKTYNALWMLSVPKNDQLGIANLASAIREELVEGKPKKPQEAQNANQ